FSRDWSSDVCSSDLLVLVIYVLVRGAKLIRRTRAWRFDWGRTVMLATGLLVASKLLDRSEAVSAAWFGFTTPVMMHRFIAAFEEIGRASGRESVWSS